MSQSFVAKKAGSFDAGVETLLADRLTIIEARDLFRDKNGATTQLLTLEAQWAVKIISLADITARREGAGGRAVRMRNGKSGKVALFVPDRPWLDEDGHPVPVWKDHRQGRTMLIPQNDLDESHWEDIDVAVFNALWQSEAEEAALLQNSEAGSSTHPRRGGSCGHLVVVSDHLHRFGQGRWAQTEGSFNKAHFAPDPRCPSSEHLAQLAA